jgi:Flp pilus assembly pilin Flp
MECGLEDGTPVYLSDSSLSTLRLTWLHVRCQIRDKAESLPQWEALMSANLAMKLWKEEEAQDLTEYALLLVLLTLAAIGSLSTLATAINGVFGNAAANLNT